MWAANNWNFEISSLQLEANTPYKCSDSLIGLQIRLVIAEWSKNCLVKEIAIVADVIVIGRTS